MRGVSAPQDLRRWQVAAITFL